MIWGHLVVMLRNAGTRFTPFILCKRFQVNQNSSCRKIHLSHVWTHLLFTIFILISKARYFLINIVFFFSFMHTMNLNRRWLPRIDWLSGDSCGGFLQRHDNTGGVSAVTGHMTRKMWDFIPVLDCSQLPRLCPSQCQPAAWPVTSSSRREDSCQRVMSGKKTHRGFGRTPPPYCHWTAGHGTPVRTSCAG